MTGLPTTQILLDNGTGTFPHDITNRCRLLDGFNFNRGRDDEQSSVTAGTLSLALNNSDGRFTPGSTVITSPSPITVDQRIRLKETVNGVTYTRFTGYVKSWRVSWPAGVDSHSVVHVTATCAQARAERRTLRSIVEEEILTDSPNAYYTLGEPAGSTSAADSSGSQQPALTETGTGTGVAFGNATGPGTDGLTAAEFAGGKYLTSSANFGTIAAIECAFSTSTAALAVLIAGQANPFLQIQIDSTGHIAAFSTSFGFLTGPVVTDGLTHVAALRYSGTTVSLLLDGVVEDSAASALTGEAINGVNVGGDFTGTIAHLALFSADPGATRLTAHADAMLTGFAGESGTARITRLAGYAGLSLGTLDTSLTNVPHKDITGASAMSAIQEVVDAEGGLAYVNGSGNLIFLNRNDAPEKTTPDLTLAAELVSFSAEPTDDDAEILNYFETTAEGTGVTQVVTDAASETAHGRYPDSKSYLVQTDAEALDRGNWLVANYAEPTTRFGTLTVNLYKMTAAQASSALAALEPGAWLRVTGMPTQNTGGTQVDVMVQGFAEEQTASSWTLTCNVTARELFEAWILGDTTYSVLGSTTKLYY